MSKLLSPNACVYERYFSDTFLLLFRNSRRFEIYLLTLHPLFYTGMRRLWVRRGAGAAAALAGCAGGQALYLKARYDELTGEGGSLPAAKGPLSGIAHWRRKQQQQQQQFGFALPHRASSSRVVVVSSAAEPASPARLRKNILFIGDSLVTGVGCSQEAAAGPALPRAVAQFVSERMRVDVSWAAIGETGGDVRELREHLMPQLCAEVGRVRAAGQQVDAVVVLCGLNDYKKAISDGKMPWAFRRELRKLITEVKVAAGVQCTVVLPALPVHRAPVFEGVWPLQPLLATASAVWDEQKAVLGQTLRSVAFVRNADADEWWSAQRYWAVDGIHPNDEGYRVWGEHIGGAILPLLRQPRGALVSAISGGAA